MSLPISTTLTSGLGISVSLFTGSAIPMETAAIDQALDAAALPDVIRAIGLPDMHPTNRGIPNGFVLATHNRIYPALIGSDINCGVRLYKTSVGRKKFKRNLFLNRLAARINLGKQTNDIHVLRCEFADILGRGVPALANISDKTRRSHPVWDIITPAFVAFESTHMAYGGSFPGSVDSVPFHIRAEGEMQFGTLGRGNHFAEVQVVDNITDVEESGSLGIKQGAITLMLHTGSRLLGHLVNQHYQGEARRKGWIATTPGGLEVPYFEKDSESGNLFMAAMRSAANYAFVNRLLLGALIILTLHELHPEANAELLYDAAHNMITLEEHERKNLVIHRKGASRALPDEPVLIPGSMGSGSFFLLGGPQAQRSLNSINHGAGRVLTRREALGTIKGGPRAISDKDFREATWRVQIVSAHPARIKAEGPHVYKPIDPIIDYVVEAGMAREVAQMKPCGVLRD